MRVAKILLYNPDGAALVLRRSKTHPHFAYEPDLPGGIVERGESYEQGVIREVQEEAGIEITPGQLVLIAARENYGFVSKHLYAAHLASRPAVTLSWEHDQYEWVKPSTLREHLESTDSYMSFVLEALQ